MNKQESQKQVSIIINGVRYDSVEVEDNQSPCNICEVTEEVCNYFDCCPIDTKHTFVKSDKKFEV